MSGRIDQTPMAAIERREASRLGRAGLVGMFVAGAFALAAAAALWASEGARVFLEAGFSAVLACL